MLRRHSRFYFEIFRQFRRDGLVHAKRAAGIEVAAHDAARDDAADCECEAPRREKPCVEQVARWQRTRWRAHWVVTLCHSVVRHTVPSRMTLCDFKVLWLRHTTNCTCNLAIPAPHPHPPPPLNLVACAMPSGAFDPAIVPHEVWALILGFVSERDVLTSVSRVCVHLKRVCASLVLRRVSLDWAGAPPPFDRAALLDAVSSCTSVDFGRNLLQGRDFLGRVFGGEVGGRGFRWTCTRSAKFRGTLPRPIVDVLCSRFSNLETLALQVVHGDAAGIRALARLKSIRSLTVSQSPGDGSATGDVTDADMELAASGRNLRFLSLKGFRGVRGKFLRAASDTLQQAEFSMCGLSTFQRPASLVRLSVRKQRFAAEFLCLLACSGVSSLCVDHTRMYRRRLAIGHPAPSTVPCLRTFSARSVRWTETPGGVLEFVLRWCPHLHTVDLGRSRLSAAVLQSLSADVHAIRSLDLTGCGLAARHLACLKHRTGLRKLVVSMPSSRQIPAKLGFLAAGLQSLDVSRTFFCLKRLLCCKRLVRLGLFGCQGIDDAAVEAIALACPGLQALNLIGTRVGRACFDGGVPMMERLRFLFVSLRATDNGTALGGLLRNVFLERFEVHEPGCVGIEVFASLVGHRSLHTIGIQSHGIAGPVVRNSCVRGHICAKRASECLGSRLQVVFFRV